MVRGLEIDDFYPSNEDKNMNTHDWKMLTGLIILALIGALQALHGVAGWSAWIDLILPILLAAEHTVNGNTE